jgi:hypothetical protein
MRDEHRWEPILFNRLRSSRCTHVHIEKAARRLYRSWIRVRAARLSLERAKRNWYGAVTRPVDPGRPFCFVLRRMKRTWREADRANDLAGIAAHQTIGATEARRSWSSVMRAIMWDDEVIRIRHQHCDEPAILISESRFRELERAAVADTAGADAAAEPSPRSGSGDTFLTEILGSG